MGPIYTLDDLVDMVRRRARLMLSVIAWGCIFSLLLALSQQPVYQSTEVIQITRSTMADDLSVPQFHEAPANHFEIIEQRLMARGNMLQVINAFDLFAEVPDLHSDELVRMLRDAVRIEGPGSWQHGSGNGDRIPLLSVTAEMANAFQARQVAGEFSRLAMDLNTELRIEQAGDALAFHSRQQDRLAANIRAKQSRISALRSARDPALADDTVGFSATDPKLEELVAQLRQLRGRMDVVSTDRSMAEARFLLEKENLAERLTVIEPAAYPASPLVDNRKPVAILGCSLSVVLAFLLAWLQELRNPVIRSAQQMEREVGISPLASIPTLDMTPPRIGLWQRYLNWLDGRAPKQNLTT